MGNTTRSMQQIVTNLQNQRIISQMQCERYMSDFNNSSTVIADVKKFINDPSLTFFLQYYINYKYKGNDGKFKNLQVSQPTQSRKQMQDQLTSIAEFQIKSKIILSIRKSQQFHSESLKNLSNVVIQQNYQLFRNTIKQMLLEAMKISQFSIMWTCANEYVYFSSDIEYVEFLNQEDFLYKQSIAILRNNKYSTDSTKTVVELSQQNANKIIIFHSTQKSSFMFQFTILQNMHINIYKYLQNNAYYMKLIGDIIQGLAIQFQYSNSHEIFINNLIYSCKLCIKIIEFGVEFRQQIIKGQIISLISGTQYKNISEKQKQQNIIDIVRQYCLQKSQNSMTLHQIQKSYDRFRKQLQITKSYVQQIQQRRYFLDFNKYSQLRFCFVDHKYKQIGTIKNCWKQKRIKIIDIMSEKSKLLALLRDITKMNSNNHIIQQLDGMIIKAWPSANGTTERLTIYLKNQKKQYQSEGQFELFRAQIQKQNKNSISMVQEKLVKDLQKQDPNLRKTGWLKLFVQQNLDAVEHKKTKQTIKRSVTDIEKIQGIQDMKLNILSLSDKQQNNLIWSLMKTNEIFNIYVNDEQVSAKFDNFLVELKFYYNLNKNKFHNYYHGINVMHMCHLLTNDAKIQQYLSNLDIFSILLSSLCHDVGHSGFSNSYQISTLSQKALTYNDISPLENYQASKMFQILKNTKNNFLSKMQRQKYILFKQNVIHNILSTDMKEHFNLITKFKQWSNLSKQQASTQSSALTTIIVHMSDFIGSCKQFSISKQWAHRLNLEFINQYQHEKKLGIQSIQAVSDLKSMKTLALNEISYIKVIILPLYKQIFEFSPSNSCLKNAINNLNTNLTQWEKLCQKQTQK